KGGLDSVLVELLKQLGHDPDLVGWGSTPYKDGFASFPGSRGGRTFGLGVQPDGKILVGVERDWGDSSVVVRFDQGGLLDATFGTDGTVALDGITKPTLEVAPDGSAFVVGEDSTVTVSPFDPAQ